jgi:ATP-dependent exoDNAse (exonuclease V) alpha subunit
MAIYHLSIKIISRGKGKSAVAAAAYRAGEKITNDYDGIVHDYTRKGCVAHTEILLPANAPLEYKNRATLWNVVEKIEKAKNSQLAREIEIALPAELTLLQNKSLIREYVKKTFVEQGMCADICIHDKGDGNPHAHIMLTMRLFNEDNSWGGKQKKEYILDGNGAKIYDPIKRQYQCSSIPTTDWNEHTKAEEWRVAWAEIANRYLNGLHQPAQIDHRSFKRQTVVLISPVYLPCFGSPTSIILPVPFLFLSECSFISSFL